MAEYIERSVAKDELIAWATCIKHPEHLMKEDALYVLDSIPSADVVPVVRCKDCKHRHSDSWCDYVDSENFFCARGERKDGNGYYKKQPSCTTQDRKEWFASGAGKDGE